jgi:hypothetical protein
MNWAGQNKTVELEGFEPSSKQAAKGLSTCLSPGWLSRKNWSGSNLFFL